MTSSVRGRRILGIDDEPQAAVRSAVTCPHCGTSFAIEAVVPPRPDAGCAPTVVAADLPGGAALRGEVVRRLRLMFEVVEGRRVLRQLTGLAALAVLTYPAAAGRCFFVGSILEAHVRPEWCSRRSISSGSGLPARVRVLWIRLAQLPLTSGRSGSGRHAA